MTGWGTFLMGMTFIGALSLFVLASFVAIDGPRRIRQRKREEQSTEPQGIEALDQMMNDQHVLRQHVAVTKGLSKEPAE